VPHEALAGNYLRLGDGHLQQVIAGLSPASAESGAVESLQEPFDAAGKRRLYQLLVVDGALVSALRIDAPKVVGDGTRTLAELIGRLENEPRRRAPFLRRVRVDESLRSALAASGWRLEDVPPAGVEIALEGIRDLEDGAVPFEVTGEVHPYNEQLAIAEAAKRGFPIAAVHILISNIARSGNRGFARVLRVDPEPDVFLHSVAGSESLDRVSVKVLDALYPPGLPSRIPIALVLGERGTIRKSEDRPQRQRFSISPESRK
jgi:cyanophycin synthetase